MRLFQEHVYGYPCRWAAMQSIAGKIGCTAETLRSWVVKAEAAADPRDDLLGASADGWVVREALLPDGQAIHCAVTGQPAAYWLSAGSRASLSVWDGRRSAVSTGAG